MISLSNTSLMINTPPFRRDNRVRACILWWWCFVPSQRTKFMQARLVWMRFRIRSRSSRTNRLIFWWFSYILVPWRVQMEPKRRLRQTLVEKSRFLFYEIPIFRRRRTENAMLWRHNKSIFHNKSISKRLLFKWDNGAQGEMSDNRTDNLSGHDSDYRGIRGSYHRQRYENYLRARKRVCLSL